MGRFKRFVVAEDSMRPHLQPGDGVVAIRRRRIRRGDIRCFEQPGRPGFWLVKRVGDISADRFQAVSDNPSAGAVDSRSFGPVPVASSYHVVSRFRSRRAAS